MNESDFDADFPSILRQNPSYEHTLSMVLFL